MDSVRAGPAPERAAEPSLYFDAHSSRQPQQKQDPQANYRAISGAAMKPEPKQVNILVEALGVLIIALACLLGLAAIVVFFAVRGWL